MASYQTIKGTYDILPDRYAEFAYVETLWQQFLSLYGYKMMRTPHLEHLGVYQKENDTSDMVTKEMFTFTINGHDYLCLRPEGTAGIIRAVIEHKLYNLYDLPLKIAYQGEMFRYERPQKGRQRQFTQLGVENIGAKSPLIDAEVIALGYFFLKTLGLKEIKVCLNSLGDQKSRLAYKAALQAYFTSYKDELCPDCQRRLAKNPLRILDCKVDRSKEFMHAAPQMSAYLTEEAKAYFAKVQSCLKRIAIPYELDERLVRGLDYYTDTVFEVISTHDNAGAQSTIFGGGRYDSLIAEMGGPELSGIGFAIGEERLVLLGEAEGIFGAKETNLDVYLINLDVENDYALEVATLLRNNGFMTEMNFYQRSLKAQFKSAERQQARFIAIVGEDERNKRTVTLKDQRNAKQESIAYDDLINYLDEILGEEENAADTH